MKRLRMRDRHRAGGRGVKYNSSGIRKEAEVCGAAEAFHKQKLRAATSN